MQEADANTGLAELAPLIGEWEIEAGPPEGPPWPGGGRTSFEWIEGGAFVRQRWTIELPEAPDGVAIIGRDRGRDAYFQLYTDERDVHRVYEMSFADGEWKLWREADDPFPQRFLGRVSDGGETIAGRWERRPETDWETDFDLTYRRVG